MAAYAPITYKKSEASSVFDIPFDYLSRKFITVEREGVLQTFGVDYDFLDKTRVRFLDGAIPAGVAVTLERHTDPSQRLVSWKDASVLKAADLELSQLQLLHVAEEAAVVSNRALRLDYDDRWNALGHNIKNLADPVKDQDATTKKWSMKFFTDLLESVSGLVNTTKGILYDSGNLFDYLKFGVARRVDTIADLRLLSSSRNQRAKALGYYKKGDKGGGDFYVDEEDTTSLDDGFSVIVAVDGARWKRDFRTLHIKQAGAIEGSDIAPILNKVGEVLSSSGGGCCKIVGTYKLGSKVKMYPGVDLIGAGWGRANRLELTHSGTAFETYSPPGSPEFCIDSRVSKLTIVGKGTGSGVCFSIRNAMMCEVSKNEIANFGIAFVWNSGHTPSKFVQAFFNKVSQNMIKPCGIGHYFGGAANRNTFSMNSIADNQVAYDFSALNNWSETNLFLNESIEGCRTWAEWGSAIFSQTWEGLTIENPSTNGFVCTVKDPGRQVIKNLALIPLGNSAAITKYNLYSKPSMILGSAGSSDTNRLGFSVPEPLDMYDIIQHHTHHASASYSGTINAGTVVTFDIPLATAQLNDRVDAYELRSLFGCIPRAWAGNGVVHVSISNPLASNVTIPSTEISVILKRAF
ncbi:phage tail fiber protein [Pseudomonas chlororaphis]|uniref:phage tail fiber domain-containing protein n=1 Tax=Pseudomonas chlororaphis TaxID=587753 RepID=UPI0030D00D59